MPVIFRLLLGKGLFIVYLPLVFIAGTSFLFLLHLSSKEAIHGAHLQYQPSSTSARNTSVVNTCVYPLHYYKPVYKPLQSYKHVRLVFYKKHKMSVAVNVARTKGWLTPGVVKTFDKLASYITDDTFTIIFSSSKELSNLMLEQYVNKSNVLAAGIPGAFEFTGAKREQYLTYQKYLNSFGCSIEELKMMPSMYLLDDNLQCRKLFDRLEQENGSRMWVLKNSRGFGGDQVEVVHNTTVLANRFGQCEKNGQFIVQEYIQNMLLVDKRKFDVRALILIANTRPYMLFYHEGYLRVVMKPFDPGASREVHLTNTHVQSLQPGFVPDKHFWSFSKFQKYLDENVPGNGDFVSDKLVPYIKKISKLILQSGVHLMKRSVSTYQLLGLDLMVTTDWNIWFIESNNYPLWPQGGWITEFTTQLGDDMFDLLLEMRQTPRQFVDMKEGAWFHSWQLFWKEKPQGCAEDESFNPCV